MSLRWRGIQVVVQCSCLRKGTERTELQEEVADVVMVPAVWKARRGERERRLHRTASGASGGEGKAVEKEKKQGNSETFKTRASSTSFSKAFVELSWMRSINGDAVTCLMSHIYRRFLSPPRVIYCMQMMTAWRSFLERGSASTRRWVDRVCPLLLVSHARYCSSSGFGLTPMTMPPSSNEER